MSDRKESEKSEASVPKEHEPFRVRLPGFITEKEIGLGDVIKRATYAIGIKPCKGCERRASALNQWVVFTNTRSK